ncbi:MAG: family 10 glycosylhydrolase [Candidatus Omnitrophota bacterium]
MNKFRRIAIALYLCLAILSNHQAMGRERAIWVTRWDYKNADEIAAVMENAKNLGASDVLFQVRGNAAVSYPSKIEPWAWELTGTTPANLGVDPGWDPLQTAIEEAQKRKLGLHAWINVFPGWRGLQSAPAGSNHVWMKHRSWFMIDQRGKMLLPSETFYSFLSPGQPDVRAHLAALCGEMAKSYPGLAGVHLDYVRYPALNEVGNFRDFSYDDASVKNFTAQYGKKPRFDLPEWQQFKRDQVTASIRAIREAIQRSSPTMQLSATFAAEINKATSEVGQDPKTWFSENLVDWAAPMAYERDVPSFRKTLKSLENYFTSEQMQKLTVGVNVDFNSVYTIGKQLESVFASNSGGEILFAYSSLYPIHRSTPKAKAVQSLWREERLKEVILQSLHPTK